MTPTPGASSSLPSSSPLPQSGAADPAMSCAHGDLQVQVQQFRQTGDPQAVSMVSGLIQASPAHPGPVMQGDHPSLRPLSVEVALRRIQPDSSSIGLLKTDSNGRFSTDALAPGSYTMTIRPVPMLGDQPLTCQVNLAANTNLSFELTLDSGMR